MQYRYADDLMTWDAVHTRRDPGELWFGERGRAVSRWAVEREERYDKTMDGTRDPRDSWRCSRRHLTWARVPPDQGTLGAADWRSPSETRHRICPAAELFGNYGPSHVLELAGSTGIQL